MISGGGTAGHVYPALAVVSELGDTNGEWRTVNGKQWETEPGKVEVLFVGGVGGIEAELVQRAGLPFRAIHAGGLHGVGWRAPLNALKLSVGFAQAWRLVGQFQPDVLFLTGGYVGIPVALAARLRGVPILVYLPDVEPALSVRVMARLAQKVTVTTGASRRYLPAGKVVVTGYPVRPALREAAAGDEERVRAEARRVFGLQDDLPTVLVFGGSRGARSINRAVVAILEPLLEQAQVIHISGRLDVAEMQERRAQLPERLQRRYHLYSYLHEEMGLALRVADLVVSRAGASILGEFPLFGLPAVLVPYPYAWRYQRVNADYLVRQGAAVCLDDERLSQELWPTLRRLLDDEAARVEMRERARSLACPDAAQRIAAELSRLVAGSAVDSMDHNRSREL